MTNFGYLEEYWPGTTNTKSLTSGWLKEDVPEGYGFIAEGMPLPDPVDPPPTTEQLLVMARTKRDRLLTYATLRINPLQYAADLDEASAEDLTLLKSWKKYSSAVNKTESNPGWPESPQWPEPPVPIV